ncbi:MAG: hypothetical protein IJ905_00860 [Fibrobacter sp.]|nr:hypothetical protein [Fibrobacter sp.]
MDIKKCKVQKNCEWSAAVVKGLAVTLGMSALVSLEGCASNVTKTSNDLDEPIPTLSSSSELSSSSMFESISSSSSNDSDNETQMIEKILKKLDSDPFNELSEEEIMEELRKYIESHREEPSGGVMEND